MKKRLLALLLLCVMLLGVFGCGGANEKDTTADDQNEETTDSGLTILPENLLTVASSEVKDYVIIYPSSAKTKGAQNAAELIRDRIAELSGVTLEVKSDVAEESEREILVGRTNRIQTLDVEDAHDVKDGDYVVCVIESKICVYATKDQSISSAANYFLERALYSDAESGIVGIDKTLDVFYSADSAKGVEISKTTETEVFFALNPATPNETLCRLTYTGGGAWRIQAKMNASDEFDDIGASQRLSLSLGEVPVLNVEAITVKTDGDVTTLSAGGTKVKLNTKAFQMDFYAASGKLVSTVTNVAINTAGSYIEGKLLSDEAVFGTGERFDAVNQRGKVIDMFSTNIWSKVNACYMAIPLLSTSRGAGIFLNRYERMIVDLAKSKANIWSAQIEASPMDCYIYATDKIADVIKGYSDLSGYAEQPEEWTYGMIVCRYSPDLSQKWTSMIAPSEDNRGEGVYDTIAMMEKYDLPWTGILAEGWGYERSAKHKDLKELCDYVHSLGKKMIIWMRLGQANSFMTGYSDDYMLSISLDGGTATTIQLPQTVYDPGNPDATEDATFAYLDITNPDAVEWFFNDYWDYLSNEIGIDGAKIDFCEMIPENYEINFYDQSTPTAGTHHWYPGVYCAMFFEMLSQKADSGMNYTRGGGIGIQRAPYMWAGDQFRGWESLHWQLRSVLSSGLSGVPYMSYDMSGYMYGSMPTDIAYEAKVFVRGTQFTAFTICMQTHGKVRTPYKFAEESPSYAWVTDTYRAYVKLHEALTPYITEYCAEASSTGMPVMRHLILHYQDDKNVYGIDDEYMFGDAFLIAPVLTTADQRNIYLPEGEWKDLNTGTVYTVGKGGQTLENYAVAVTQLPVFYNMKTTSQTAEDILPAIEEIFEYLGTIQANLH